MKTFGIVGGVLFGILLILVLVLVPLFASVLRAADRRDRVRRAREPDPLLMTDEERNAYFRGLK